MELIGDETAGAVQRLGMGRGRMKAKDLFSPRICFPAIVVNNLEPVPVQEKLTDALTKTSLKKSAENQVSSSLGKNETGEFSKTPSTSKTDPLPEVSKSDGTEAPSSQVKHDLIAAQASVSVELETTSVSCAQLSPSESQDLGPTPASQKKTSTSRSKEDDRSCRTVKTEEVSVGPDLLTVPNKLRPSSRRFKRIDAWVKSTVRYSGAGLGSSSDDGKKESKTNVGGTASHNNLTLMPSANAPADLKESRFQNTTREAVSQPQLQSDPYQPLPDDIAPPPEGFPGSLAEGEVWRFCPYYKGHTFLNWRAAVHLGNCHDMYKNKCYKEGKLMDIKICLFDYDHHVHIDRIDEHEEICEKRAIENNMGSLTFQQMKDKLKEGKGAGQMNLRCKKN